MTAVPAQPGKAGAEWVFLVALALWAGALVFYSLVVLPALFSEMPSARAGEVAALVFPRYYRGGLLLGALMLASSAYLATGPAKAWRWALLATAVMVSAQALAAFGLEPRMVELRGDETLRGEFMRLHGLAMALNALVMAVGLGLLAGVRGLLRSS